MITINPNKEKTLTFSLTVEGINPKSLTYTLRLSENGRDYGFIGENNNGDVTVKIPPLTNILNKDRINNISRVRLDIHDNENKYFMMPFEDTVLIEKEPVLSVVMTEEKEGITENKVSVKMITDEDKVVTTTPKKKTGSMISKFLEDK